MIRVTTWKELTLICSTSASCKFDFTKACEVTFRCFYISFHKLNFTALKGRFKLGRGGGEIASPHPD